MSARDALGSVAAGIAYVIVGVGTALLARASSSPAGVKGWRLAAWVLSLAVFVVHFVAERRAGWERRAVAIRVALGVALGAFGVAALGPMRSHWGEPGQLRLAMLSLVAWPVLTGIPALMVAWIAGGALDRGPQRRAT